jgi:hypothetical protein
MSYHSQCLGANGDTIAGLPEAAAGQPSWPTITDRTVAMAAELHALPALLRALGPSRRYEDHSARDPVLQAFGDGETRT